MITPVAELDEVEISGVRVKRATLHNFELLESMNLNIGDKFLHADNKSKEVKDLEVFDSEPEQTVHNFILDGNNTYYADGLLAHNRSG